MDTNTQDIGQVHTPYLHEIKFIPAGNSIGETICSTGRARNMRNIWEIKFFTYGAHCAAWWWWDGEYFGVQLSAIELGHVAYIKGNLNSELEEIYLGGNLMPSLAKVQKLLQKENHTKKFILEFKQVRTLQCPSMSPTDSSQHCVSPILKQQTIWESTWNGIFKRKSPKISSI